MKEKVKEFLRAASTDVALRQELKGAKDIEAILETAKARGFDLTSEDFDFKNTDMEEISEDEMRAVAGGSFCDCSDSGIGNAGNLYCNCPVEGFGTTPECDSGYCHCLSGVNL